MNEQHFTEHVQSLLDGTFDNSDAIVAHLKRELKRQLRKMGQWNLSPGYLGFDGDSWERSEALDDLTQEAYISCIQKRLAKLAAHVGLTGSCEGSVRRKITWFLQERQRKGNPISRRIFNNVRTASESLVETRKADTSQVGKFDSRTVILAAGQSTPSSAEELANCFSEKLGDREFFKWVGRNCPTTWKMIENAIEKCFSETLRGYQIGELSNLLSASCRYPDRLTDEGIDEENGFGNIWGSISEIRTNVLNSRYSEVSAIDHQDQFSHLLGELLQTAEAGIKNERIKRRILNMLEKIAELIREGEDARELSCRKLASLLGVSKSTLAEDIERLKTQYKAMEEQNNETES
jgi:hypothetical protein